MTLIPGPQISHDQEQRLAAVSGECRAAVSSSRGNSVSSLCQRADRSAPEQRRDLRQRKLGPAREPHVSLAAQTFEDH
jgi:hypothetical protein